MSVQVIHSTAQIARKEYYNDGRDDFMEWIRGGMFIGYHQKKISTEYGGYSWINDIAWPKKLPFCDLRIIVQMRAEDYRIKNGTLYRRQFNSYDGDAYTWRSREDMYQLMCKYDLFPEV